MTIKANLNDGYKYITTNEVRDFYIKKIGQNRWFTYAMEKGTNNRLTMAGFTTKKEAVNCANIWAGWMK